MIISGGQTCVILQKVCYFAKLEQTIGLRACCRCTVDILFVCALYILEK